MSFQLVATTLTKTLGLREFLLITFVTKQINLKLKNWFFFFIIFLRVEKMSKKSFSWSLHISSKMAEGNFCPYSWEHVYSNNFIQGQLCKLCDLDNWKKVIVTKIPKKSSPSQVRETQFNFHLLNFRGHPPSCCLFTVPFSPQEEWRQMQKM